MPCRSVVSVTHSVSPRGLSLRQCWEVNVSNRLLRQNTLHRCRGGWMLSDVRRRKTCRTTSAGRCLFHTTPPLPTKLRRTQAFRHTLSTQRFIGYEMRLFSIWNESWTHSLERGTKLQHAAQIQSLGETHSCPWWGGFLQEWSTLSLCFCVKKK